MPLEKGIMTAQLQCTQKGGPFKIVDVPIPALERDQVLIRQRAIALNDLDRKQRDLGILVDQWPHVLGIEGAGIVEAVGADVSNFQPGDEAIGWAPGRAHGENWGGSYQERVVIPVSFVAKKPRNISIEDAASLPDTIDTDNVLRVEDLLQHCSDSYLYGSPSSTPFHSWHFDIRVSGWSIFDVEGGVQIIPALTKLVEEGKYKVHLPVNVVGHGLEEIPNVMDRLQTASGEKLIVTL